MVFKIATLSCWKDGGADRDRTGGLLVANEALSQLSYSPTKDGMLDSSDFNSDPVVRPNLNSKTCESEGVLGPCDSHKLARPAPHLGSRSARRTAFAEVGPIKPSMMLYPSIMKK